tara:strand:- start:359 stop:673 length:315 start_codon:yes stop_codon:yes gene_type:complete
MAQQKNISGVLTQELLAAGDNVKVNSITMTNTHTSSSCYVSLYIAKKLIGKFYLLKGYLLQKGETKIINPRFNNSGGEFGLFIKLDKMSSSQGVATPTVDIIIR